jgi:hypothetical protein
MGFTKRSIGIPIDLEREAITRLVSALWLQWPIFFPAARHIALALE